MSEPEHPVGITDIIFHFRDLLTDLDQWLGLESHQEFQHRCVESDWYRELCSCLPRLIGWLEQASGYEEARIFQRRIDAILKDSLLTTDLPASTLNRSRCVGDWLESARLSTLLQKAIGACDVWLIQLNEQDVDSITTTHYVSPTMRIPMSVMLGSGSAAGISGSEALPIHRSMGIEDTGLLPLVAGQSTYANKEMEARDRFIYEQKKNRTKNQEVIRKLEIKARENRWVPVTSARSINACVIRYVRKTGAQPLPENAGGRPSKT